MVRMAKLLILFKFRLVSTKKDAHKPEQQLHQGTLRELHNMTETFSNEECPTQYETVFNIPDIKPQMEWSLIGSRGAISPLHTDSNGLGTLIVVLNGSKYWILMM